MADKSAGDLLREMDEKATKGPWSNAADIASRNVIVVPGFTRKGDGKPRRSTRHDIPVLSLDDDGACGDPDCCGPPSYHVSIMPDDVELIVATRNALPALARVLDAHERLIEMCVALTLELDAIKGIDTFPSLKPFAGVGAESVAALAELKRILGGGDDGQ